MVGMFPHRTFGYAEGLRPAGSSWSNRRHAPPAAQLMRAGNFRLGLVPPHAIQFPAGMPALAAAARGGDASAADPARVQSLSPMQVSTSRAVLIQAWSGGTMRLIPATFFSGTGTHSVPLSPTMML